jgi:hypothetical protein
VLVAGLNETPITPGPFAHHPWPESAAEKVELKSRMIFTSTLISAIDDFRLVRMQRQSAISKPRLKSCPQHRGLVFCAAVANRIVGIALERYVREIPAHPHIERIMKKEICQEGLITPPCGVPLSRPTRLPSAICTGAFSHLSMYKSAHWQSVCLRTARISSSVLMLSKKALISRSRTQSLRQDRCRADRIERRFAGPVSIGIRVELWFRQRFPDAA